jgi:adenylate cyclase, class 2
VIEVELKYNIENLEQLKEKINNLQADLVKNRIYELSVMYDNELEIMQKTDGRIRLRKSGDEVEFCYKKPITREGIKKEIEYEVNVSNFETLEKIINEMGYFSVSSYERYRTTYKLDNAKITIDEYPFANFLEIEGEDAKILEVSKKLGFNTEKNITDSCDSLFNKWREANNLEYSSHMRFEDFGK